MRMSPDAAQNASGDTDADSYARNLSQHPTANRAF
jgi:hypothetical protein